MLSNHRRYRQQQKKPRTVLRIYRVAEPAVANDDSESSRKHPLPAAPAELLTFSYPDGPQDAESLLVEPRSGNIYILTKNQNKPSGVYLLKQVFGTATVEAVRVSELTVPAVPNGLLTGGDISADGRHVVICDYFAAYELPLPKGAANFDEVWKQKPATIDLGDREQGEAIAYSADGNTLFATSEKKNEPIVTVQRISR